MPPPLRTAAETRALLAKVLPLLGSPLDGEALAAARQAAKALEASGLSWEQILGGDIPQHQAPAAGRKVETVWSRDGTREVSPPVGATWNETVLWLVQRKGHSPLMTGVEWLDRMAIRLKRARDTRQSADLTFDEAMELHRLYERIARP